MWAVIRFTYGKDIFMKNYLIPLQICSRAHFTYNTANDEELSIRVNDIFHVTDTLYNGQVGSWVATKLNAPPTLTKVTGAIPNKTR